MMPMSPADALPLLEHALLAGWTQIGAGFFDWNQFVRRFAGRVPPRFSTLLQKTAATENQHNEPNLLDRLRTAPESNRIGILRSHVQALALRVLGFGPGRSIDLDAALSEMGLDSLMAVEFRNALAAALGENLRSTLVFDYPSVNGVTTYIMSLMFSQESAPAVSPVSALDAIEELSDEDVDRMLASRKVVLL
jgi:acyl carrier protein